MVEFNTHDYINLTIIVVVFVLFKFRHTKYGKPVWDFCVVFFGGILMVLLFGYVKDKTKDIFHKDDKE